MKPKKRNRADSEKGPALPLAIGWQEYVALLDWGIRRLKVKIDTGARTSAIDVASYELRHDGANGLIAVLQLALDWRHPEQMKTIVASGTQTGDRRQFGRHVRAKAAGRNDYATGQGDQTRSLDGHQPRSHAVPHDPRPQGPRRRFRG